MKQTVRTALLALAGLAVTHIFAPAHAADPQSRPPVVLELFTSQGCSSCPAADALLGEIAESRDDVLVLSFHVDYWNYIGWEDKFATDETTTRQRRYARSLGISYVYTPQLVINGETHEVGSNRSAVMRAIDAAHASDDFRVAIGLDERSDGAVVLSLPDTPNARDGVLWLVNFDRAHTTQVKAGENTGRTITNHRVVRSYRKIGEWRGEAADVVIDPEMLAVARAEADGCALIVQVGGNGPIIGARAFWVRDNRS